MKITSEIGKLKTVLVHRPGKELENLTPDLLEKLLFDDIPFLKVAQEEHDYFVKTMQDEGIEVLYLTDLLAEALKAHPEVYDHFINSFIEESKIKSKTIKTALFQFFKNLDTREMILKMIEGVRTHEINIPKKLSIMDMLEDEYPFYTDPIPNLIFQRDPFSTIGSGVCIGKMSTLARQRETLFSEYIINYHPRFKTWNPPHYYSRNDRYSIEGGDVLVLSDEIIAAGISNRTDPRAIEHLAEKIFNSKESFKTILAFNIPKSRAFMHLDTVFTQVDYNIFTIHPGIEDKLTVFEIQRKNGSFDVSKVVDNLDVILMKYLKRPINLIRCGGKDLITATREQWNDGANTLCVSPGTVIVYDRNQVTNDLLRNAGVTVLEINSSELSRGRGGPRCMTMPLEREDIK